jgi:hypothetical protein
VKILRNACSLRVTFDTNPHVFHVSPQSSGEIPHNGDVHMRRTMSPQEMASSHIPYVI